MASHRSPGPRRRAVRVALRPVTVGALLATLAVTATAAPVVSPPAPAGSALAAAALDRTPASPEPSVAPSTEPATEGQVLAAQVALAPLSECAVGDDATRFAEQADWPRTLLDTRFALPADYVPDDLVPVSQAGVSGGGLIRAVAVEDLRAMADAARAASAAFAVRSAYRSYGDQQGVHASWQRDLAAGRATVVSARAGHSEHQLGTGVDLRSAESTTPPWQYRDWGTTAAGTWLREHSWEYGFVLSYPAGAEAASCYDYEPWHFRYVGREQAAAAHGSGLTLREHLWQTSESR